MSASAIACSTYYHRDDVEPYWVAGLNTRRQIGRHIFYGE